MIDVRKGPGQRVLELGCGESRHPQADVAVDLRKLPHVDFALDMEKPFTAECGQAVGSDEFDCVICVYALEHVSWRNVSGLLSEVFRVTKPGGKTCFVTSNTEKQIEWALKNPEGWDGKGFFESVSGVLFGDCDYPQNSHKCYFTPGVLSELFVRAGFRDVLISPYGARHTDLVVEATKPEARPVLVTDATDRPPAPVPSVTPVTPALPGEELFDKHYFNGGGKVGGYAREGYWDYPVNHVTFDEVMKRRPQSVLELGCARGYVVRKLQDAGVTAHGLDVSRHCYLTRACDGVSQFDLCSDTPWPFADQSFDLCTSKAFLEHVPEHRLPRLFGEMKRVCRRALHGIDFGQKDDGFDRTHCSLFSEVRWRELFDRHAPGFPVEVVDKESLERGVVREEVLRGCGRLKLNLGACTVMYHYGWENVDVLDLTAFAAAHGYKFRRHDLREGLPYGTGVVDLIHLSHVLEHFTPDEGEALLRECRRVLRKDGLVRIAVPDAGFLSGLYVGGYESCARQDQGIHSLGDFAEINDGVERAKTDAQRLWALLHEGHRSCYDQQTLKLLGETCGFRVELSSFRMPECTHPSAQRMRSETLDQFPDLSLFCTLYPDV